jgi:hypothetical protein
MQDQWYICFLGSWFTLPQAYELFRKLEAMLAAFGM